MVFYVFVLKFINVRLFYVLTSLSNSLHGRRVKNTGRAREEDTRGDTRGEKEGLPETPTKFVSRPLSNYLASNCSRERN